MYLFVLSYVNASSIHFNSSSPSLIEFIILLAVFLRRLKFKLLPVNLSSILNSTSLYFSSILATKFIIIFLFLSSSELHFFLETLLLTNSSDSNSLDLFPIHDLFVLSILFILISIYFLVLFI